MKGLLPRRRLILRGLLSCRLYLCSQLGLHTQQSLHQHTQATSSAAHATWHPTAQTVSTPIYKAVLIDAAGTLLKPTEPAALVYLRFAEQHGVKLSETEILQRYRKAYNTPWSGSVIRYVGDARPFWRHIVHQSTGCDNDEMFEQIYDYYQQPHAWSLPEGAVGALQRLKQAGVKLAVVSNFDTRLRPLLVGLGIGHLFDEIVVSAEVGAEKPNPVIFEIALKRLGVQPEEAVHIGDDRRNDIWGARDAGIMAWMWGQDVHSFDEVAYRVVTGREAEEDTDLGDFTPMGAAS